MPRILIPTGFTPDESPAPNGPAFALRNPQGHRLSLHPVSSNILRVVHELPADKYRQKVNGGIEWEPSTSDIKIQHISETETTLETSSVKIVVSYDGCPRLQWFAKDNEGELESETPFLADSRSRAYAYEAVEGGVLHYVERENYLPVSEDELTTPGPAPFVHPERNEFVYGLGESRGTLEKSGKKFTMEGRDGLSYDWENGDPLYKVNPFYSVYNKRSNRWYGIFYNSLVDSSFDLGAEADILWGCFRSYRANSGPLDYYVLLGDGTLPSIVTAYASLVSPTPPSPMFPISASPSLPPLSQLGYLSSSLSLAADPKAQEAVINFLRTSKKEGFPVDGLYLSSGWCQDVTTDNRHYFAWNRERYPDPRAFAHTVEKELQVQLIVNVKPWLLETHPMLESAEQAGAFVRAAEDARGDETRSSESGSQKDYVWGAGFGSHELGRYFDFSSQAGSEWWKQGTTEHLIDNGLTGVWIDNNEMAGMVDGDATFRGELGIANASVGGSTVLDNVEKRMGWRGGSTTAGSVGKAIQTIGMARATYEALLAARPNDRPVIVSRSGVPGVQAYAHATWSGDNSTTWKALKWGTKMTLSVGMSFGPGLYGHDIGGFAGKHHPLPELLVRWCQNGAWHSRFTVHSWKEISTTLWMYNAVPGISDILRDVLGFRYRLAPTFYSLYLTHYHRQGWPLLKPLLWHHSVDPSTLKMDEDFLFGSHVLVASVTEKGATFKTVYLPAQANDGDKDLQWCELDTGIWHSTDGEGRFVELGESVFACSLEEKR
ncbi:glycosyl hydrolases family 31-domain-containing protein [Leucosporidium creatinivorum]|uniref:Glycosyl hydrolases family 31-domain-containing protein n=1 Tax=Leucosporidium creatinivorum TaxID=106004 RepID=A0A1Y2G389_9BASI|nr:glycosyl hydrolases family 31-domain-containing protein [Leucosporidium creatinivorum]